MAAAPQRTVTVPLPDRVGDDTPTMVLDLGGGETFVVWGEANGMEVLDLAAKAQHVTEDPVAVLAAFMEFLDGLFVDPVDAARFRSLCRRRRTRADDLLPFIQAVIGASVGEALPFTPSSESSDGPSPAAPGSAAGFASPGLHRIA